MSSYTADSTKTYTVDDFIKCSNNSLCYDAISLYDKDGDTLSISYNLINDYLPLIKEKAVTVVLDDNEYNKYLYKPKLLAYDVYKNTELYYVILLLNNVCSVKEFDFSGLTSWTEATSLSQFVNAISSKEGTGKTVYLSTETKNVLTTEQKNRITSKGWTIR